MVDKEGVGMREGGQGRCMVDKEGRRGKGTKKWW